MITPYASIFSKMNETSDIITYLRIIPVVCLTFVRGLVPNSILERGQKAVKEEKRHRRRKKTDDCKEKRNWKTTDCGFIQTADNNSCNGALISTAWIKCEFPIFYAILAFVARKRSESRLKCFHRILFYHVL